MAWPGHFDIHDCNFAELNLVGPAVSCVAYSATSPTKKSGINEDGYSIISMPGPMLIAAVADGVGGHNFGARASRLALETLHASVQGAGGGDIHTTILSSLETSNQRILQESGFGAATTFIGITLTDKQVQTYNVGDSGALVFGAQGKLKLQTLAHSPVADALRAGIIDEQTALKHTARNIVSNVLGTSTMHVTHGPSVKLSARDTLVIASDGLYDNFLVQEIVDIMRKGPLPEALRRLVETCQQRMQGQGKADDLTVVALRLNTSGS